MALRKVEIDLNVPFSVTNRELAEYVASAVGRYSGSLSSFIKIDMVLVTKIKREDSGAEQRVAAAKEKLQPPPVVKKGRR